MYPAAEYEKVEGHPLPAWRLAAIWRTLPEAERFSFVLSLDAELADAVIVLTMPVAAEQTAIVDARDQQPGARVA